MIDQLPHNLEAESSVLGAILIDPDCLAQVATALEPHDFYLETNRWIYEAYLSVGDGIDPVTVSAELNKQGRLGKGKVSQSYLSKIVADCPTSVHAEHYARIVAHLGLCRRVINAAGDIAKVAHKAEEDALGKATQILSEVKGGRQSQIVEPYANAIAMSDRYTGIPEERDNGVPFGFLDVDKATGNMFGGEEIIFGGNTSMGKTQFIMGVAINNADKGTPVLYVSSEMQIQQWNDRVVSMETGIDLLSVRRRAFTEGQERQVLQVVNRVSKRPIYLLPSSNLYHASRMAGQYVNLKGVRLIIFDYLQQFTQSLGKSGGISRYEQVSYVSRSIKQLAMDLNVPIIAVVSLSRSLNNRDDKWPMLSDIRESGTIEFDADLVMFIHRPGYYVTVPPEEDLTYITINKQRQGGHLRLGPDNAIPITWLGQKYVDAARKAERMM